MKNFKASYIFATIVFKSTSLLILMLLMTWGCASSPPPEPAAPEDLIIRKVSVIPGFSKKQLFDTSKIWVAQTFSDSLDVIQYANSSKGTIIGKTFIPHVRANTLAPSDHYECRFTIIVETKDQKIRTTYRDMYLMSAFGPQVILKSDMEVIRPKLENAVNVLISSFTNSVKEENW
ncbi:DUF4468 domain-containing protein [Desulfobacterales bacterium HSG17]|nr:DUF4468 domain-containing protein [Desulfobacterales bacterium HSG17]